MYPENRLGIMFRQKRVFLILLGLAAACVLSFQTFAFVTGNRFWLFNRGMFAVCGPQRPVVGDSKQTSSFSTLRRRGENEARFSAAHAAFLSRLGSIRRHEEPLPWIGRAAATPNAAPSLWDVLEAQAVWKCGAGGPVKYSAEKFLCEGVTQRPCVVYSFGSNGVTEFEQEVARRHPACEVHIFDPTYKGVFEGMGGLSPRTCFHEVGLGGLDGRSVGSQGFGERFGIRLRLPVRTLRSLMDELGHSEVDILKIDIEGSEWPSFEQIYGGVTGPALRPTPHAAPKVGNILVELHAWSSTSVEDVLRLHSSLSEHGFRLVHQDRHPSGHLSELSYIHQDWHAAD